MKLPKSVLICGVEYKVKANKSHNGGSFSEAKHIIEIGTADCQKVLDIFLHEVIEAIYAERKMRLIKEVCNPDNGDYFFCYNHEQHELAMADLAIVLKNLIPY